MSQVQAMRKTKFPRVFAGELTRGGEVSAKVTKLLRLREERKDALKKSMKFWSKVGGAAGAIYAFRASPSFRRGLAQIFGSAFLASGVGGALSYRRNSKKVKAATLELKLALVEEAAKNSALMTFLQFHNYIYVDKKGRLVGAKTGVWGKLGFGYLRMNSNAILKEAEAERSRQNWWGEFGDWQEPQ